MSRPDRLYNIIAEDEYFLNFTPEEIGYAGGRYRQTPLMLACQNKNIPLAMFLISTGHSHPEKIDSDKMTALGYACEYGTDVEDNTEKMEEVALAIINTGQSNPGIISHDGYTPLMSACLSGMNRAAIGIIETGQSNPQAIDGVINETALILACRYKMEDVALALILSEENILPNHINDNGQKALDYAMENGWTTVVRLLEPMTNDVYDTESDEEESDASPEQPVAEAPLPIPDPSAVPNANCFDAVMRDNSAIHAFISEDVRNNFVLKLGEHYSCNSLAYIRRMASYKKTFIECNDDAPSDWQGDTYSRHVKPGGRVFVQLVANGSNVLVVKPDWIFDGPVPFPHVFELVPQTPVKKFVTSDLVPRMREGFSAVGTDHCNQSASQMTYKLVPLQSAAESVPPAPHVPPAPPAPPAPVTGTGLNKNKIKKGATPKGRPRLTRSFASLNPHKRNVLTCRKKYNTRKKGSCASLSNPRNKYV